MREYYKYTDSIQSDKQGNYSTWLNCKHIADSNCKDLQNHHDRNQLSQHFVIAIELYQTRMIDSIDDQSVALHHLYSKKLHYIHAPSKLVSWVQRTGNIKLSWINEYKQVLNLFIPLGSAKLCQLMHTQTSICESVYL